MAKQIWIKEETAEKIKNFLIKSYGKPVIENRSVANIVEYGVDKLLENAEKESPTRDAVESLAQNYNESKNK